jgi:hypothetical protein
MYLKYALKLPSSHTFCESNYKVVQFIAEYYNTITGLALCVSSILFYKNNKKLIGKLNNYLHKANCTLFIVGIGTIFFHGTLLYIFQLFDEIPMLLMTFDYIYILLSITKSNYLYIYYIKYFLSSIIILSYWIHPILQIITFFTFFTTNVCIIIFLLTKIPTKYKNNSIILQSYYLLIVGCIILLIWIIDSLFCSYVQHLYLHSIWHIVTSILIYLFNNLLKMYIKEYNFNKIA